MHIRILLTVIAAFSLGVVSAQEAPDESAAIQKLQVLGGKVTHDAQSAQHPVIGITFGIKNRFSDKYAGLLKSFQNLKAIDFRDSQITAAGLKEICTIMSLTSLDLCGSEISDESLSELRELKNLTELTLTKTDVTSAGLKDLQQSLPKLRVLNKSTALEVIRKFGANVWPSGEDETVYKLTFDEAVDRQHRKLPADRENARRNPQIKDADFLQLKGLRGLTTFKQLFLFDCNGITDASIQQLAQFKDLELVKISGCSQVTGDGLQSFQDLKELKELGFQFSEKLTDAHLKYIAHLEKLMFLNLSGCSKITDTGIEEVSQLSKLTFLDLSSSQITGAGIRALGNLKELSYLQLNRCNKVTDVDLPELEGIPSLRYLQLTGVQFSDTGMKSLAKLSHLYSITISSDQITNAGLAELKELQELRTLHIQGNTRITDDGLKELKVLKKLHTLNVVGCAVTQAGCNDLKKSLPKLSITR